MNYLILTCKFGMGHMSVSNAIKDELVNFDNDINVEIVDVIDYMLPNYNKPIYNAFNFLVGRFPKVYNFFYNNFNSSCNTPAAFSSVEKIKKLIDIYNADIIISTMPVCSQFVAKYKKKTKSKIPMYTFITDITVSPEWINDYTDKYFVGDDRVKKELMRRGISDNEINVTGIPVKQCFKVDNKSNVNEGHIYKILMMGGGLGLFSDEYEKIIDSFDKMNRVEVTVITGKNKKAYSELSSKYKNTNILGYVDNVDEYMRNADLIISKPGGITLFESIYSSTPLYVINPLLAQEINNAKFIEDKNIGRVIWNEKEINVIEDILNVLGKNRKCNTMKNEIVKIKNKLLKINLGKECSLEV